LREWQQLWFLDHDNAPSHTSLVVQQFLPKKNIAITIQQLCCPDLALNEFWLFTMKMGLKETHFTTMEDIISDQTADSGILGSLPSLLPAITGSWCKHVHTQGFYFEGD
jgi:hypothetical protein